MTGHTPGPWQWSGGEYVRAVDGRAVARLTALRKGTFGGTSTRPAGERTANAKLIASAPEQQAKIDALADALEALISDPHNDGEDDLVTLLVVPGKIEAGRIALRQAGKIPAPTSGEPRAAPPTSPSKENP
jgi:antitoxin (DNA-binding transcriptional repressor) of toxin-antitoxin stability system